LRLSKYWYTFAEVKAPAIAVPMAMIEVSLLVN
jgi:hypothetical protein